eukprot:2137731-Pleurochrysis_carterae.AAC.1
MPDRRIWSLTGENNWTDLSTAEKTGPVLSADDPFLNRVGSERDYGRKILKTIRTIDDSHVISPENSANTFSPRPRASTMLSLIIKDLAFAHLAYLWQN